MRSQFSVHDRCFPFPCMGSFTSPGINIREKAPRDYSGVSLPKMVIAVHMTGANSKLYLGMTECVSFILA